MITDMIFQSLLLVSSLMICWCCVDKSNRMTNVTSKGIRFSFVLLFGAAVFGVFKALFGAAEPLELTVIYVATACFMYFDRRCNYENNLDKTQGSNSNSYAG